MSAVAVRTSNKQTPAVARKATASPNASTAKVAAHKKASLTKARRRTRALERATVFVAAGVVAYVLASLIGFTFLELARRDGKIWAARSQEANAQVKSLQRDLQDRYLKRLPEIAGEMGFLPAVEIPVTVVAAKPGLLAANVGPKGVAHGQKTEVR
ncbi:MAG: hypothetical protein K8R88_11760 [Armatimonadetes bacterium]|nr:hypothetical protein [Armatimonadota bacterium]